MTKDEIVALYKAGKSLDAIGKLCGKSRGAISGIVSQAGASRLDYRKFSNAVTRGRVPDYSKPPRGSVALLYAKPNQCRWPHKGDAHFICGCKTLNGLQYCAKHMDKAYQAGTAMDLTGLGDKYK